MRQLLAITEARQWDILGPVGQAALLRELALADGGLDLRLPLTLVPAESQWCLDMRRIADQARAAGCRVRAHSWVGRADADGYAVCTAAHGESDGRAAAAVAEYVDAERYSANAEHAVHRGRAKRWQAGAVPYLRELAATCRRKRSGAVDYVGFPDPSIHYRYVDGTWARHLPTYDALGAMMYQRSRRDLLRRWKRVARVWPVEIDGRRMPRSWWTGIGRDAPTGGDIHETMQAWRDIYADDPDAIHEVTWYCGLRQGGDPDGPHQPHRMLIAGRPGHPPLVEVIPMVAEEWPA